MQEGIVTDMNAAQITYLATEAVDYRFSEENMYVLTGRYRTTPGWRNYIRKRMFSGR